MTPFLASNIPDDQLDTVRVYLYARQSSARTDGSEVSTGSQLQAGHALVASRNAQGGARWVVVGEFVDVGRSGWDPNVIRAEFESMMTGIRAGNADVTIVNDLSRLTRQGAHDALEIDTEFKAHGVRFMSVLEPFLDTSTPIGVAIFALIAALAKQDSDVKAQKLRGVKSEIAAVGGRHSSQPPFAMRHTRKKIGKIVASFLEPDDDHPDQIELVERMATMCEQGFTDNKIASTFQQEGQIHPGEAEGRSTENRKKSFAGRRLDGAEKPLTWRAATVRNILNHPGIGGFASSRVKVGKAYQLVIQRDPAGKPIAPHTGILEGSRWLALQELRSKKTSWARKPGADVAPTLLSGWRFLGCHVCQGAMGRSGNTDPNASKKHGYPSYMCANPKGHGGLAITRTALDDYVAQRVWARLATVDMEDDHDRAWVAAAAQRFAQQKDIAGVADERRDTQSHLDNVTRSIKELQADRREGLYQGREELQTWRATMQQYRSYEATCKARLAELEEQISTTITVPMEWFNGEDPTSTGNPWATWDVYEKREFLSFFLDSVSVGPGLDVEAKKRIPIEERVHFKWAELHREEEEDEATEAELAAM